MIGNARRVTSIWTFAALLTTVACRPNPYGDTDFAARNIDIPNAHSEPFNPTGMAVGAAIGQLAPEIVGIDTDGNAFKLSDYRGRVVVLSFFGVW